MGNPDPLKPPRFLYRYRPLNDYSLQEIALNSVYACPLTKLNDDEEGTFSVEKSNPTVLRGQLTERAVADGEIESALLIRCLPDEWIVEIEKEALTIGTDHLDARGKWGVVCFTERFDNIQMWARYADDDRGCVIEYDLERCSVPILPQALWKVTYGETRGSTSLSKILDTSNAGMFSEVLSVKGSRWAYEEEWRLLVDTTGAGRLAIPISRVITGINMPNSDKNRVVHAILKHGTARFAEMYADNGSEGKRLVHDLAGR